MKRRDFMRMAAGGIAAATFPFDSTPDRAFQHWTWVHGGGDRSPSEWKAQYGRLAEAGFHGVLVSGGETPVHAEAAHASGLEFQRWVWTLNRNEVRDYLRDSILETARDAGAQGVSFFEMGGLGTSPPSGGF